MIKLIDLEALKTYDKEIKKRISDSKLATEAVVDTKIAELVGSAPETLDTLNELAQALGDDPNFATTVATQLGQKVDKIEGKGLSTEDYTTAEKEKLASLSNYDDSGLVNDISTEQERINKIKYYDNPDIEITPDSYFTFSEDGKTLLSLNDETNPITEVVIPYHVEAIGERVFADLNNLTSIIIPNSVQNIGSLAFSDCISLTNTNIPYGVTTINDAVFGGCIALTSVNIPDSVTYIGADAFSTCANLTNVVIPNGVTSIGVYAFGYCTNLTSIHIPSSVTAIDATTFYNCSSDLTIICEEGSYAETYAKEHNITVKYETVKKITIDNKIDKSAITTEATVLSTDEEIPTAKAVFEAANGVATWLDPRIIATEHDIDQINETIMTKTDTAIPETLTVNVLYDLGEQTSLTLNLPSGQLGDFIQVDFLSTATPTTLTITATSGLSDYDLIPEANTIYSLYFNWIRLDATTYGWGFGYAEYTRTVA